jgi:hypothetical protein
MQYEAVRQITRKEYEQMIQTNDPAMISNALLSISYWESDWRWTEDQLLLFAEHRHSRVRYTAALGFGHIARFNGHLDFDKVEPVLKRMANSGGSPPEMFVRGAAEESLEDIEIYIHKPRRQHRKFEPATRLN